jgi:hypothetical protein
MTAPHPDTAPLAHADVIVLDYLAALWAESDDLSPALRDDLMQTVADYIAVRRTADVAPISDPEQIVGRLGPPEALVAAVRRGRMPMHLRLPAPPAPRRPVPPRNRAGAEVTAIALLMAGTPILPVVSPLAAMVIVSASPRWSVAQKAAAWLLAMGAALAGFLLGLTVLVFGNDGGVGLALAYLTAVAGAVIAGIALLPGLANRHSA